MHDVSSMQHEVRAVRWAGCHKSLRPESESLTDTLTSDVGGDQPIYSACAFQKKALPYGRQLSVVSSQGPNRAPAS